jgi:hypothetical protein
MIMETQLQFWQLSHLTDTELVARLGRAVHGARAFTAELLAHLAEVEERRLHLRAARSSLFSYCVSELGFSEDEACRRIEVARLARRHPELYSLMANGEVSLSVAALLKPHITAQNAAELLRGVRGKSVLQAREFLACRFPRPDVPSSVRKLPGSAAPSAQPVTTPAKDLLELAETNTPARSVMVEAAPGVSAVALELPSPSRAVRADATEHRHVSECAPTPTRAPDRRPERSLSPLAADRYAVRFTATGELKRKLEQARDLLRHALPDGDFAPVIERALDLLLEDLLRQRFGKTRRKPKRTPAQPTPAESTGVEAPRASRHVSNPVRRVVFERDAGRCAWIDRSGRRCESRAFLELDHREPAGIGGASDAGNVRLLCQAHNRLEAERVYGREHVDAAIARSRRDRARPARAARAEQGGAAET